MKIAHRTVIRTLLSLIVVGGFFAALYWILTNGAQENQVVLILVGALAANFGAIVQFYFGSSAGSELKTEMMGRQDGLRS